MPIIRSPSNCRCSLWFPYECGGGSDGLLMMDIIMPETCWAVSARKSNKILRLIVASSWVFYLSACLVVRNVWSQDFALRHVLGAGREAHRSSCQSSPLLKDFNPSLNIANKLRSHNRLSHNSPLSRSWVVLGYGQVWWS